MKGGTAAVARQLVNYYQGGRRIFGYSRWASAKWAVQMVLSELRPGRH